MQVYGGIFNGDGTNTTANKDSTLMGVGRAVVRVHRDVTVGANVATWFGTAPATAPT